LIFIEFLGMREIKAGGGFLLPQEMLAGLIRGLVLLNLNANHSR
jgi:hypothetical protein